MVLSDFTAGASKLVLSVGVQSALYQNAWYGGGGCILYTVASWSTQCFHLMLLICLCSEFSRASITVLHFAPFTVLSSWTEVQREGRKLRCMY